MKLVRFFIILLVSFYSFSSHAADQSKKAILITGASSGLGLKMTELLSKNGFIIYAGARKEADLKRLEAMDNVESIKIDVTIQSDIDAAVKVVADKGRGLHGLINNAGVAVFGPIIEVDVSELDYQLDVNVLGPYRVTQAFAPMLIQSKGRIATTGSIAGTLSASLFGQYSMSKHAVEAFTDSLASEMERFGVHVGVIEPGSYASQIGNTAKKRLIKRDYWKEDTRYSVERTNLFAGLSQVTKGPDPLAVAEAALHIMSNENPKRRYMVVHAEPQAERTIRKAMREMLELNHDHVFSYDQKALIEMLQEEMRQLK